MKNNMANLWNKNGGEYESSARVVDGNLILSLPDAINPVVWRMELGSVKASALEVKKANGDGAFMLSLKTPKGEVHDIAPYDNRDAAVTALMRVSAALQGAQGQIAPPSVLAATTPAPAGKTPVQPVFIKPDRSALKWILALAGVVVVIFMFAHLSKISAPVTSASVPGEQTATSTTGQSNVESGVPQSADEMLKGLGGF
jgi:hypothetical protein